MCGVADPVSTCVHPTEHPNLWGVDGSRDVSVDTLRVEVGKVLHSTCCVFPVHPRLLMKVIHVVVVWACVVVFEIFGVDGGGEGLETHEKF